MQQVITGADPGKDTIYYANDSLLRRDIKPGVGTTCKVELAGTLTSCPSESQLTKPFISSR